MQNLANFLNKAVNNTKHFLSKKENLAVTSFFILILVVLLINAFHEEYPDEYDNILGGKYLLQGIPLYKGYFTHHGPVAYILSAFILFFSRNSFVIFRVLFALLIFAFLVWTYYYQKNKFGSNKVKFYIPFIAVLALAGNYYWFHMLLADSISAYFFAPVVSILLLTSYYKHRLRLRDMVLISILTSASILSSLTYLYLSIAVYLYSFYLYLKSNEIYIFSKRVIPVIIILAAPYLVFLVYLLVTFSLFDYLYQGFTFNQRYYIYNYPRPEGVTTINPIRFAIVIANAFYNNYFTLLQQIPSMNVGFPLNITMALGTASALIYFFINRNYLFSAFFALLLIFSNSRSNPLTSAETDYQSAVYIMIAFLVIPFVLSKINMALPELNNSGKKLIYYGIFVLLGFYSLFSVMFLGQKFFNRTFEKYMGNAALIYDRSEVAPIMNKLVSKNEYTWIGPFAFEELFYLNAKNASRYQIFIPGLGFAPEVREPFIAEFEKTKPKIIWFQKNFHILGRSPELYGQFFIDYLNSHYTTLMDLRKEGSKYVTNIPITERVDIETRLYIRNENKDEVISRLLKNGFIKESESEF